MNPSNHTSGQLSPESTQKQPGPLNYLQNEINQLFDDLFGDKIINPITQSEQAFIPAIDVINNNDTYLVRVELPGLNEKEIDLYIEDGYLVLKGERKETSKEESDKYIVNESVYGCFYRSLPLPDDVDTNTNCKATLSNGILTIELTKIEIEKRKPEKISIQTD